MMIKQTNDKQQQHKRSFFPLVLRSFHLELPQNAWIGAYFNDSVVHDIKEQM